MNFSSVKNAVTSKTALSALKVKKVSPEVMFGAGIVGITATVVLACRATLKVEHVLDESEKKKIDIRSLQQPKHVKKDLRYVQIQTMFEVGKLYAPAVGLGVVSIGLLTGSHVALTRRNVALTAAYKALEEGFDKYRDRIREEYGEEKEREFYRGVQEIEIHNTKNGKVEQKKYINQGGGPPSPYAVLFDEHNKNWVQRPEYNLLFLRAHQDYANERLFTKGYVLLNDVLQDLGFERTKAGCIVGWVKGNGDDYIDFGIFDKSDRFHDFIRGDEPIWLDFNVDGVVFEHLDRL